MSSRRVALIVVGAVTALIGIGVFLAGAGLLLVHATQRDADGFYTSPTWEVSTDTFAITSEDVALATHPGDWLPREGALTLRVTVVPADADTSTFIGIAPADDLAAWLDDVAHERITRVGDDLHEVATERVAGTRVPGFPGEQSLWVARASGPGEQTLTWDAQRGEWTVAVLSADGSAGLAATLSVGVRVGLLLPIAIGLLLLGLVLAGVAAALLVAGIGRPSPPTDAGPAPLTGPVPPAATPRRYPLVLDGRLDTVSRWQWLVKWLLALPHVVVLALLWAAFAVLTVVAGIAILFTGRYPRRIFDFNVGVLRWTWRVTYYAFGVLGTDRYPPFRLASDPRYPADLDIARPERLSRGLVLVKWWLLAIPHYLVIGLFTGGIVSWSFSGGDANEGWQVAGGGLIGVLVIVAAVMLLVSGRYPQGLYDVVMGLQRWVYRVIAYAALMTDEYPPFRFDAGGPDPSTTTIALPPDGSDGPAAAGPTDQTSRRPLGV